MTTAPSPFDAFDVPPPWPESLLERIREHNARSLMPLVVLDDDPLGGQCLHDTPVLTNWHPDLLAAELEDSDTFLLLTNTRALSRAEAIERARDVGFLLLGAAAQAAILPTPIWRSDSTLRGHFWWEMQAFASEFPGDGAPDPVYVFLPYFGDGGRYTLNDTQYVLQNGALVPAAETEFARDPAFAYQYSHLPAWLEAHSEGHFKAEDVMSISLEDLRLGGPERIASRLADAPGRSAVVVNAIEDRDLEVFIAGLQMVEAAPGAFLCSGTSSFARVRAGQEPRPPLNRDDLDLDAVVSASAGGGLTIVGSYVDRTVAQLQRALALPGVEGVELDPETLGSKAALLAQAGRAAAAIGRHLEDGDDVILHTMGGYLPGAGDRLRDAIDVILQLLPLRPVYLLVKGGTTASDIATHSLGVRRATVLGQLLPGVPTWRLGPESRWPGLTLTIFAGNVGTPESLAEALQKLRTP